MNDNYVSAQRPSGKCPGCSATVQLTSDGHLYEHHRGKRARTKCMWSGLLPPRVEPAKAWQP